MRIFGPSLSLRGVPFLKEDFCVCFYVTQTHVSCHLRMTSERTGIVGPNERQRNHPDVVFRWVCAVTIPFEPLFELPASLAWFVLSLSPVT